MAAIAVPEAATAAPTAGVRLADLSSTWGPQHASAVAVAFEHPVTVEEYTDETTLVTAQPDGTYQFEGWSTPQRAEVDGEWLPIDTSLEEQSDGYFSPAATTVAVAFAPGGSSELARIQSPDGSWITEELTGIDLPSPTVEDSSAIYLDVIPGVDLRLTATASGMSEVIIINSEAAAEDPRLADLEIAVSGAELSETPGGGTAADTGSGLLMSSSPSWWDSSVEESDETAPAPTVMVQPVEREVEGDAVILDIAAITESQSVVYPLYVDPDWAGSQNAYWFIDSAYPTTSYLNGAQGTTSENVGYISSAYTSDGRTHKARTFYRINTSALKGAEIYNGTFNTTEVWSFNCTASRVDLYLVSTSVPVGGTWNSTGTGYFSTYQDQKTVAYGNNSSCPAHSVGFSADNAAEWASNTSSNYTFFGLKANNETTSAGWKRFSPSVSFVVDFDFKPDVPTSNKLAQPDRVCGTALAPVSVNNAVRDTKVSTVTHDKDSSDLVSVAFTLTDETASPPAVVVDAVDSPGPAVQGTYLGTIDQGTLTDGSLYSWTAVATDPQPESSAASPPCYFQVDNSEPEAVPAIDTVPTGAMVGHAMDVRFSVPVSAGVTGFMFWWSSESATAGDPVIPVFPGEQGALPACDSGQGLVRFTCVTGTDPGDSSVAVSSVIDVAPIGTDLTLWVVGYDAAGNLGNDDGDRATGISVSAALDDRMTYSDGHGWVLDDPLIDPAVDRNVVVPLSLVAQSNSLLGVGGYELPGFTELNRYGKSGSPNKYWAALETVRPAGYNPSAHVAEILPDTGQSTPANMRRLCTITSYENRATTLATGVCPAGYTSLGFLWVAPPALGDPNYAAGFAYTQVYRCVTGSGSSLVTWVTSSTCGSATLTSFGYALKVGGAAVTSSVVDTSGSFTVSAKLTPNPTGHEQVALSGHTPGASSLDSIFSLGLDAGGHWKFCVDHLTSCVVTDATAAGGSTVQVTAVHDAVNHQLRIYLGSASDPVEVAEAATVTGTSASTLFLGSAHAESMPTLQWGGTISGPSVFPGVASDGQLFDLSIGNEPGI